MSLWLSLSIAAAHPVGDGVATQTTVLEVHRDHVVVEYVAEVPLVMIRTAARATVPDPFAAMADELGAGLVIRGDGQDLNAEITATDPRPSSPHTWAFGHTLRAELPAGTETVAVSTANLPEAKNHFAAAVRLSDGWRARRCSVLQIEQGRVVADHTLRWRQGDAHRQVSVDLGPRLPRWFRAVSPQRVESSCARALVPSSRQVLLGRGMTPAIWLVVAVGIVGVGASTGRAHPRALVVLIAGPLFALIPPTATTEGLQAVAVALTGLVALRLPGALPFAAMVAVAALASAMGPRSAGVLVALAAAASRIRSTADPRSAWIGITLIGVWLHARALVD